MRCQRVLDALCHQPKGWTTNQTVTVWQTFQVQSDKLSSRCVTSYLSALVTSKTNLQLRCQQVLDALCHQPKSWSTNGTVTMWQTTEILCDKLTNRFVTSFLTVFVTSKTGSYATNRFITSCSCVVSESWTRYVTNQELKHKQNSHHVTNYRDTMRQTN